MCIIDLGRVMHGFRRVIEIIGQEHAYLSDLDGAAGDGDHGIGLVKCFRRASQTLENQKPSSIADAFEAVGNTFIETSGGATGPLYGMFFLKLGEASQGKSELTVGDLADMFASATDAVAALGGAQPGDKTMIDTLDPAARSLRGSAEAQRGVRDALALFDEAAKAGMESTESMQAMIGRASRLGERSRGHLDAGAASSYFVIHGLVEGMLAGEAK